MKQQYSRDSSDIRTVRHEISLRSLISVILLAAGCWVLIQIWPIILILVIALILAGTLSPIVSWMQRFGTPRPVALVMVLLLLVLAIAGFGALLIPALLTQISMLAISAPALQNQLAHYLAGIPMLATSAATIREAQPQQFFEPLAASALTLAATALQSIILSLTTVVLSIYILADPQRVKGFVFALLPREFHLRLTRIFLEMEAVVGGYVRGQVLISACMGLFIFILLWAVGAPAPIALAVFAAFADLIPFVGAILVFIPVVIATLSQGVVATIIVAVLVSIYVQAEAHVLIPRIHGFNLRLPPIAVVVALLIGGQLLGILGALLALPIAASVRVLVEQLRIELPGEQPGEEAQRAHDAEAEARYVEQTEGISALDAVAVATSLVEQEQDQEQALMDHPETVINERSAATLPVETAPRIPLT